MTELLKASRISVGVPDLPTSIPGKDKSPKYLISTICDEMPLCASSAIGHGLAQVLRTLYRDDAAAHPPVPSLIQVTYDEDNHSIVDSMGHYTMDHVGFQTAMTMCSCCRRADPPAGRSTVDAHPGMATRSTKSSDVTNMQCYTVMP